ncbi:MAG: acetoacetate decarboxylase family protein [Dehalococcoidia bacterium]|nr:MAG: acetoacetate decarboxylase family protein [Dehalococcoidia bacterium]
MPYKFKPRTGYFMPANFGPLSSRRVCHYGDFTQLTILYLTDKDSLAAYLPEPFEPAEEPIVTVYCQVFREVDFLAGRGYNVVGVNLAAVFNGKKDNFTGNYAAILWENDTIPIITGRELLGAPKFYADIPDPQKEGNNWSFHCSLYGTKLVRGEIRNSAPVDDITRQQIEQIARDSMWMGWKYIPKANWRGSELSFPTAIPTFPTLKEVWLGECKHTFFKTQWRETLYNSQIMTALRKLKVKEYRAGLVSRGTLDLLVGESRKME